MPLSRTSLYTALGLDVVSITVGIPWEMTGNVFFYPLAAQQRGQSYVYDPILLLSFWKAGIWHLFILVCTDSSRYFHTPHALSKKSDTKLWPLRVYFSEVWVQFSECLHWNEPLLNNHKDFMLNFF